MLSGKLQEGRGHVGFGPFRVQCSVRNAVGFHCSLAEWLNEYFYWVVVLMFMIKEIWLSLRIPVYVQEADFWVNSICSPPCWVFVTVCGLSLVVMSGGYSVVVASLVVKHGLQSMDSVVGCMGLVALQHVESSKVRDQTRVPLYW